MVTRDCGSLEILGIIPARGGSKRIPRKNLRPFGGAPLIWHSIASAKKSQRLTRLLVSSEDDEILEFCTSIDSNLPFRRSKKLAADDTPTLPVITDVVNRLEEREGYQPDIIVVLQPTSPLRTAVHIDEGVGLFLSSNVDSVVSVIEIPHQFTPFSAMTIEHGMLLFAHEHSELENISQKKPSYVARNGCLNSICSYDCLMKKNSLYGDTVAPYFMTSEVSADIDDDFSWRFAEYCFLRN